jgi:hypothetical protein
VERSLVGIVLLCMALPATALEVGVVPATRKVQPDHEVYGPHSAQLQLARGEWEAFQLLVGADVATTGVDAVVSDLAGPDGAVLPASDIRLYREHYLQIDEPSPFSVTYHEREAGLYPDPLIPLADPYDGSPVGAPFDLEPGHTVALFVDVYADRERTPGSYAGTVTVSAGADSVDIELTAEVWPFELPAHKTMGTAFGFSYNLPRLYHGGLDAEPTVDTDEVLRRYLQALHEHRMDPTHVNGDVGFTFDADGNLEEVDWSAYDAEVEPFLDGTMFDDGEGVSRFSVARFAPGFGTGSYTGDEWGQAAAAFAEHLNERGWWDRAYVYALDEPWLNGGDAGYEQVHADAQILFEASDLWRGHVLVTSAYYPIIDGDVGIWCPVTPMFDDYFYPEGWYEGAEFYAARPDEELWFYVCNANLPPYAGYDIDTAIGYEPRIVKWGTWFEGATGFLYWSSTYWVDDDPWNEFANWDYFGPLFSRNGDGFLVYPGDHDGTAGGKGSPDGVAIDGPIVSYRMKQIRDGFEDWELFALCEQLGGGEYAREQVGRAYARFGDNGAVESCDGTNTYCPEDQPWTLDEELLAEVRGNVAAKVLYLLFPDEYTDPEAGGGDDDDSAGDDDDTVGSVVDNRGCRCEAGRPGVAASGIVGLLLLVALALGRRRTR